MTRRAFVGKRCVVVVVFVVYKIVAVMVVVVVLATGRKRVGVGVVRVLMQAAR